MMTPIAMLHRLCAALGAPTKDVRGNAAVEVALVCPVILVFLFGIIEFGSAMWLQNALDYSVAEAARCASVNTSVCGSPTEIQSYAASQSGASFDKSIFSVSTPSCGNLVSARYPMTVTGPGASFSLNLDAQACY